MTTSNKNKAIKSYTKKGITHYRVKMYGGIDPYTKKQIFITKRGLKTITDAKNFYAQKKAEVAQRQSINKSNVTFSEFYHSCYENFLSKLKIEKSTLGKIKGIFKNHILPFYGEIKIKNITYALFFGIIFSLA